MFSLTRKTKSHIHIKQQTKLVQDKMVASISCIQSAQHFHCLVPFSNHCLNPGTLSDHLIPSSCYRFILNFVHEAWEYTQFSLLAKNKARLFSCLVCMFSHTKSTTENSRCWYFTIQFRHLLVYLNIPSGIH